MHVWKWWGVHSKNVSHVICRYYNIPLVSLIKNAKILKVTSCEIQHNYWEQKVRVLATLTCVWVCRGIQSNYCSWLHCVWVHRDIQSHHHSWLHYVWMHGEYPFTSSWLTSLCVDAQGPPVTSSQLTSSICQGHPGSRHYQVHCQGVGLGLHLFNKLGWWLTALSRMAGDSRCCASQLWCNWLCMVRCVHSRCLPWHVGYCRCGSSCSWLRCCGCNMQCWLHSLGGRQVCGCSRSYICGDVLVRLDRVWVMFTNVVVGMSLLSTTHDLDCVWSMVCCIDDGGREPQASGIIWNGDSLSGKQWGFLLATLTVVVCCA